MTDFHLDPDLMKLSNLVIFIGGFIVLLGVLMRYGWLGWFGNLPLDFKHKGENSYFFAPIGSMIAISIFLSLLMKVMRMFRG